MGKKTDDKKNDDKWVSHCAWCGTEIPWGGQTCGPCRGKR